MMTFQGSTRTLRRPLKMSWPASIEGLRPFMKTNYFWQQKSLTLPICDKEAVTSYGLEEVRLLGEHFSDVLEEHGCNTTGVVKVETGPG